MVAHSAVAVRRPRPVLPPVLYVLRDEDGRWIVRRAGAVEDRHFSHRAEACAFARGLGQSAGGYRLFLERPDGRMVCEMLNLKTAAG